jgi:multiple sugar transport system ATP-binding protein
MAKLELQQVTKVFDGKACALDQVTLEVADGEVCGVVGPSGSGKTTLLRMVAGLEDPTHGTIMIGDRCVDGIAPHQRGIAMVFQNYALYPHMTVRQNLAFPLKMLKAARVEISDRVAAAAAWLQIEDLLDRGPASLSGGQRQRVALGKALIRRPEVLLLDEPLSSVDAQLRDQLRRQLREILTQARTTCLYVTHDQAEAMALADRICVLSAGKVQQKGTVLDIYERPANRFVAGFFGSPSMNFAEATVESGQAGAALRVSGDYRIVLACAPRSGWPADGRVTLGIRPHDLRLTPGDGGRAQGLRGVVTSVEPLGSRVDMCVKDQAGRNWVVSANCHVSVRPGDRVVVDADVHAAHLFEGGPAGRRLDWDGGTAHA